MKMSRRQFVSGCAAGLAGTMSLAYARQPMWASLPRRRAEVETRNTARNLIFIMLTGAPSHVDTFDLKTGSWTPNFLGPQSGTFFWPAGLLPKLAQRQNQFSLVRSLSAIEAVHERAIYHLVTAHRMNASLQNEIPHLASVLSYKLAPQRRPGDSLPGVVMTGQVPVRNGFLPIEHMGIILDYSGTIPNLEHPFEGQTDRFQLLNNLTGKDPSFGAQSDQVSFLKQATGMMNDPELKSLLPNPDEIDYSSISATFVQQCETAVKFIAANKGTRVFQLELGDWDHHNDIYGDSYGLGEMGPALDNGLSHLLDRLSALPAAQGSGSLLDETLIVATGEFGRTVGPLNTSNGRDHYPYVMSALLAGGGIQGGRAIGRTDSTGGIILDPGWSEPRLMTINDLVATIYSAMGVDWTERIAETPSGRVFEFLDSTLAGPLYPIDALFA